MVEWNIIILNFLKSQIQPTIYACFNEKKTSMLIDVARVCFVLRLLSLPGDADLHQDAVKSHVPYHLALHHISFKPLAQLKTIPQYTRRCTSPFWHWWNELCQLRKELKKNHRHVFCVFSPILVLYF